MESDKPNTEQPKKPEATRFVTRTGEVWLLALDGVTWNFWGMERSDRR